MSNPKLRFKDDNGRSYPDWSTTLLSSFSEINPKLGELPQEFDYIDLGSVISGKCIDKKKLNRDIAPSRAKRILKKNDVLFQMVRPYQKNNLLFAVSDQATVASTGYAQFRCSTNQPAFLYQLLNSDSFLRDVLERCTGGAYPAINSDELGKIPITVPSIEEQQKIASFFSTLDEKIELSERKLEALEQLKKGLMQKIFSQEIRFKKDDGSEFPVWKTGLLSDYVKASGGHTPSMKNREFWNNGKWYWVTSKDMKTDYIRQSEMRVSDKALESLKLYEPKTLLLVARSGILKHSLPLAMLECQATINQDIKALEVSKILPEFLFFYLKNREHFVVKTLVKTGTTVQSLMLEEFYKLTVFEPCMEEQKKIASFFITLDKKIQITSEKIRALKKLKQGFMQQMFV